MKRPEVLYGLERACDIEIAVLSGETLLERGNFLLLRAFLGSFGLLLLGLLSGLLFCLFGLFGLSGGILDPCSSKRQRGCLYPLR